MNALIALLHFCEVHGPCVVFCTQAIHEWSESAQSDNINPALAVSLLNNNNNNTIKDAAQEHPVRAMSFGPASELQLPTPPNSVTSPLASPPSLSLRKPFASSLSSSHPTSCPACSAQLPFTLSKDGTLQEAKILITVDEEDSSVQYVGSKAPQQPQLYKAVRQACVRSLTTEFCPGRDGPVLFGDEENGYVMSYMLKLRDSQARGEARFYSLMMLMTDRVYLVSCWPLLVSAFRSMAINLQERANAVFRREKESRSMFVSTPMINNRRMAPMSQADQAFRRWSNTTLRSLVDLLGIKDIYAQIHAQFSYILKLSARRRMEKFAPGRRAGNLYIKAREEYCARRKQAEEEEEKKKHPSEQLSLSKESSGESILTEATPIHCYSQI